MTLSRDEMLAALMASDGAYDGRFVTGVLSTGIYCLPSCRARKPKPENVRFFATFDEAREAGLRACRKCRPDAFERGEGDTELAALERLVADVQARPAAYGDVASLADAFAVGETKLFALVRRHYHTTPAALLADARVDEAMRLLRGADATVAEIAYAVGFESLSTFYAHFQARTGMNPAAYRGLAAPFTVTLPKPYRTQDFLGYLGRDPESLSERVSGSTAEFATWLGDEPNVVRLAFDADAVKVSAARPVDPYALHATVVKVFGLRQDAASFEARHPELTRDRQGLRIPQTPTLFDGLVWSVVGQQVGLGFAYALRRRLTSLVANQPIDGLVPPPLPAQVAALEEADLLPLQFSRRKAEYLIGIARDVPNVEGASATRAEKTLLDVRGLGPWAANYVMMRSLGCGDCVPLGDTGLLAGLRKLYARPVTQAEVRALMSAFAPHRSLATLHLWASLVKENA